MPFCGFLPSPQKPTGRLTNRAACCSAASARCRVGPYCSSRFHGVVVVVLHLSLVAQDLTIEFIGEFIDSGVQIGVAALRKNILSFDVDIALGLFAAGLSP